MRSFWNRVISERKRLELRTTLDNEGLQLLTAASKLQSRATLKEYANETSKLGFPYGKHPINSAPGSAALKRKNISGEVYSDDEDFDGFYAENDDEFGEEVQTLLETPNNAPTEKINTTVEYSDGEDAKDDHSMLDGDIEVIKKRKVRRGNVGGRSSISGRGQGGWRMGSKEEVDQALNMKKRIRD